MLRARRRLVFLWIGLAFVSGRHWGCGTLIIDYFVSAPAALPPGVPGKLHGSGEAELRLPAFKLRLSGLDVTPKGGVDLIIVPVPYKVDPSPIPSLMLLLVFEPSGLGLSFDPSETWVETDDGRALHPVSYVGPGQLSAVRENAQGCVAEQHRFRAEPELPRRTEARSWPLPLGGTCFVLAFDLRVEPPGRVIVNVRGIAKEGHPVTIPGVRFFRRAASASVVNTRPAALP
jgi:hypothetical protein